MCLEYQSFFGSDAFDAIAAARRAKMGGRLPSVIARRATRMLLEH